MTGMSVIDPPQPEKKPDVITSGELIVAEEEKQSPPLKKRKQGKSKGSNRSLKKAKTVVEDGRAITLEAC